MVRAAGLAGPGVEQAEVVVDLGDGADRRARIVGGGLLLDGDGRRKPFDVIDVGLLHGGQELPRVGGQRFHVASLPLGVEGVEGERRLARPGQPGDHDQLVAGQVKVDVVEIVRPRAANGNGIQCWSSGDRKRRR